MPITLIAHVTPEPVYWESVPIGSLGVGPRFYGGRYQLEWEWVLVSMGEGTEMTSGNRERGETVPLLLHTVWHHEVSHATIPISVTSATNPSHSVAL